MTTAYPPQPTAIVRQHPDLAEPVVDEERAAAPSAPGTAANPCPSMAQNSATNGRSASRSAGSARRTNATRPPYRRGLGADGGRGPEPDGAVRPTGRSERPRTGGDPDAVAGANGPWPGGDDPGRLTTVPPADVLRSTRAPRRELELIDG